MRSQDELLKMIIDTGKEDERIRAVTAFVGTSLGYFFDQKETDEVREFMEMRKKVR